MQLALSILVGAVALASVPVAGAGFLGAMLDLNPVQLRAKSFLLGARQATPNVPPECGAVCAPVVTINSCTPSECCTASYEQQLYDCFACIVTTGGSSNYTIAQATVDGLYNACAGQGLTIPILTFPGQDPGRPVSSISGAAAPTSTESQTSSQSVVTSLSAPLSTTAPVSQSTVTSLPSTTALPSVASSSPTTNSARKMEGSVDLHIPLMMIGSLIVASSLVLS